MEEKMLKEILSEIKGIKSGQESMKSDMNSMKADLNSIKKDMDSVKTGLDSVRTDLDSVKKDLDSVKKTQESMKLQQEENTEIIKALQHSSEVHKAILDKLDVEVSQIKGDIRGIRSDIVLMDMNIAKNKFDVARMKKID